jgi:hypothetical protein
MSSSTVPEPSNVVRESDFDAWLAAAVALYLIAITVSFVSTTMITRAFIEPVRLIALGGCLVIVGLSLLRRRKLGWPTILVMVLYGIALCHGLILSAANGGMPHVTKQLYADVVLTLTGAYLFSTLRIGIVPSQVIAAFVAFATVMLIVTIWGGGFQMTYPPQFFYEYAAAEMGVQIYYSQGVSKFFGLTAIGAIYLAFATRRRGLRLALFGLSLGALGLSLIGGARGDSVAAALIVVAYAALRSPGSLIIWAAAVLAVALSLQGTIVLEDFMIFNRIMSLTEDVGLREVLLREAGILLVEKPVCLMVGCGFGFFQSYYGYESGLYPHNIAIEAVIVWGLPVVLIAAVLTLSGLAAYLRRVRGRDDAFLLFYAYFLFLFLKSGTVLGAWFVMAGTLYFLSLGLEMLVRPRHGDAESSGTGESASGGEPQSSPALA